MKTRAKHFGSGSLSAALIVAVALSATGCTINFATNVIAEGSFDRSLDVSGPVDLDVSTGSGEISVRVGAANAVEVHGTIKVYDREDNREQAEQKVQALSSNPPIEQKANVIRIGRIEDPELRKNVSISYEILVPADTKLRSSTGSGNQTVEGIHGPAEVETGSGNLRVSDILEDVKAKTGSGGIKIDSVKGPVAATTGSGSIEASKLERGINGSTGSGSVELDQVTGDVDIGTGSGTIRVEGLTGSLKAHAGSGNVTAEGEPTGEWKLQTNSGNITVRLPAEAAFELDARVSSGSVSTAHPLTVQGGGRKKELRGPVRGGGPMIHARSGAGNIRVE